MRNKSIKKVKNAARGFGKKLQTPKNVRILKIALVALGIVAVAWNYQPSRKILVAAGANLKLLVIKFKSILIPPRDETSELTEVEKSTNSNKKVPKWLEKVGPGLVILIIGAAVCQSQGVTPFSTPETTSRDIEPESMTTNIVSGIKNIVKDPEASAAVLIYIATCISFTAGPASNFTWIAISDGMLVAAWQLLTTVASRMNSN